MTESSIWTPVVDKVVLLKDYGDIVRLIAAHPNYYFWGSAYAAFRVASLDRSLVIYNMEQRQPPGFATSLIRPKLSLKRELTWAYRRIAEYGFPAAVWTECFWVIPAASLHSRYR